MSKASTQLDLFLGILKSVMKKTGHEIPPHLKPLLEGHGAPEPGNLDEAMTAAGDTLENAQCACLFANIVNLCVMDGRLVERDIEASARDKLRLDRSDARDMVEAVEARSRTSHVFRKDNDWEFFCAGLIAIVEADDESTEAEYEYLADQVPETKHIEAGKKIQKEQLEKGLSRFSAKQKQCFAAHVISMMLIDGEYKEIEQQTLENLAEQMRLAPYYQERLLKGIYTLFNLSVFA
jgi:hypothetical protein